jgi:Kef-type K+ transport system membrane component KefB
MARQVLTTVGLLLFVFLAGLEVHEGHVRRQGMAIFWTSLSGMVFPFLFGFASVMAWPSLWGAEQNGELGILALFVATILCISALPVIARVLMDLNLIRSELGSLVMAAATLDDLVGWALFAFLVSYFQRAGRTAMDLWISLGLVVALCALLLSVSSIRMQKAVRWLHLGSETLLLRLTIFVVLVAATLSEFIGTHAALGAFLVGVALARIPAARDQSRERLHQFTMGFFAPLYFVSIGLQANFAANFDLLLVVFVLVVATIGKVGGVFLGARIGGKKPREALIVAFAMNARGAMGIVLTSLALEYKVISERVFVALIVQAVVTSLMSGVVIRRLLPQKDPARAAVTAA